MKPHQVRLMNAARKALFQRAQLGRSAATARGQLAPKALQSRAKARVNRRVDAALNQSEAVLRKYALPLGITAIAGLALAFRRPLMDAAQRVGDQLRRLPPFSPPPPPEHDDEPV